MPIYLDTHVAVWLYAGEIERLSPTASTLIEQNDLLISPIVILELQYLYDLGRITEVPETVLTDLARRIGLRVCNKPFLGVVEQAQKWAWTRDPFDRLLAGQAAIEDQVLLTKDEEILANFERARW